MYYNPNDLCARFFSAREPVKRIFVVFNTPDKNFIETEADGYNNIVSIYMHICTQIKLGRSQ